MIYPPSEDSFLMSRILKQQLPNLLEKNPDLKFLEIGAGSGIHLQTVLELGVTKQNIYSCDISPDAIRHCKRLGFNCVHSDLFENISGKFNLIIFNPPYLPEDKQEPLDSQIATTGGKKGSEIINKFLKQVKNHLTSDSKIFLITSSLAKGVKWGNYDKKLLGKKKLFFEELRVWKVTA
ncbi:MAG: HemK2/MTQ2 family protein methyltransferase [archaeon]